MSLATLLLLNLCTVIGVLTALWCLSLRLKDASIVDILWGSGFVLIAWTTFCLTEQPTPRALVLAVLTTIWGLRLSGYLAWRNMGQAEDFRYAAMRKRFGPGFALVSLFIVFWLQGLIMWLVSLPVQVGISQAHSWQLWSLAGIIVWTFGIVFESVGDYQLARFKADPANRGQVLDRGLWRYTRHPNYFGDFLVWWGLYLVAVEPASWWWTISGPILMSFLLIRVSGVRLLESSLQRRVEGYDRYVRRTSAFFPWPPRRAGSDP